MLGHGCLGINQEGLHEADPSQIRTSPMLLQIGHELVDGEGGITTRTCLLDEAIDVLIGDRDSLLVTVCLVDDVELVQAWYSRDEV